MWMKINIDKNNKILEYNLANPFTIQAFLTYSPI